MRGNFKNESKVKENKMVETPRGAVNLRRIELVTSANSIFGTLFGIRVFQEGVGW